jgi:hypothetical protein
MKATLPEHLSNTSRLILAAFPDGVSDDIYFPLLKILYPHMSDRNLAEVMAACSNYDQITVYNDIAKVASTGESTVEGVTQVLQRLREVGFDEWIKEG